MTHPLSTLVKSALVCAALAASALALALPSPKDIETAVRQGHTTQAESMLREVIAAKPQSAKAHYELGQVLLRENRLGEARTELLQARAIDPSLQFASSDKQFQDLIERTQAQTAPAHTASVQAPAQPPQQPGNGFSLSHVWIGIAALGVIALLIRMNRRMPQPVNANYAPPVPPAPPAGGPLSTAFGRNPSPGYTPAPAGYPSASYPTSTATGGSSVAGAVVGGLAGVAAGYALSKALEGEHHAAPPAQASGSNTWADNQGHVSADAASAAPDFDPGTGSDWDDPSGGDSGGGSDDSW